MHEENDIEKKLKRAADDISASFGGAPVVLVLGGDSSAQLPRTFTASSSRSPLRLRDLLGLLQAAIQTESWKHFRNWQ